MRTIDLRGRELSPAGMLAAVPRATQARAEALDTAARIVEDVRDRGEAALREQAERFDAVTDHAVRVPAEHITTALAELAPEVRSALEEAIRRVRLASAAQVPATQSPGSARELSSRSAGNRSTVWACTFPAARPSTVERDHERRPRAGRRRPGDRSGFAAAGRSGWKNPPDHPRGSSAAGCDRGVCDGWRRRDRRPGVRRAVARLDPVDVVSGPGNNYVASAKRAVAGVVGTDSKLGRRRSSWSPMHTRIRVSSPPTS